MRTRLVSILVSAALFLALIAALNPSTSSASGFRHCGTRVGFAHYIRAHNAGSRDAWGAVIQMPCGAAGGANAHLHVAQHPRGESVALVLYPADTLSQARTFYKRPAAVRGLKELACVEGWAAAPNFHFGHMEPGF